MPGPPEANPLIVPLIEGDGELAAVPILIRRVLHERFEEYVWGVAHPKKVGSLGALRKKLEKFITYAAREDNAQGILILLDLDDGCPGTEAQRLAKDVQQLSPRLPVAIAFAHREYEAWFLAGIEEISERLGDPSRVETIRDVKGWLSRNVEALGGYRATRHQPSLTCKIDLALAEKHSRSFRRLLRAVGLLVEHSGERGFVSPPP
jgi:hypothetical protein